VHEIGPKIASGIQSYFSDTENLEIIARLKSKGIRFSEEKTENVRGSSLNGKSIVISGVFLKHTRDEYKDIIESNGGKNTSSISGNTSFILAGDKMGESKREKAIELGIPLIDETEFLRIIGEV
jgi:DNA ligase (NAD+)